MTTSTTSIDIMGLQAAYANLHTDQERDYFMQRYHDVISSFGGKTSYDADNRPLLVMRSNLWASGYDVDGTDFFFQAEDGIRVLYVTGVQTCALPISPAARPGRLQHLRAHQLPRRGHHLRVDRPAALRARRVALSIRHISRPPAAHRRRDHLRAEIGRASCRERVEVSAATTLITKKPW